MQNKTLTLTIVIPVYNEERQLKACLDAIISQTVKPDEVIIVDNNCTDKTVSIAKKYKFVTIIKESKQGRGNARTAGFNAAKSDIIGRIDADSVIATNWVEIVKSCFADDEVAGITGPGKTNIGPATPWLYMTYWSRVYFWAANAYFGTKILWGANSAIRRSVWLKIKDNVCTDDDLVHEDQDLSLLIAGAGGKIVQVNSLLIKTRGESYAFLPKLMHYLNLTYKTNRLHKNLGTLQQPRAEIIDQRHIVIGSLLALIPGIIFVIGSVVLLPFNLLAKKLSRSKK